MDAKAWLRSAVRRATAGCVQALVILGAMFGAGTADHLPPPGQESPPDGNPWDEPPEGHPERLLRGVPLSAREQELWAQLERP